MTNPTLLIVDDEPTILTTLSKILTPLYRVRVANSGTRALHIATTDPRPELILLDLKMPDIDGYAVLTQLKEHPDTHDIPIIFVTGTESIIDEEKGLALGAADYITKPFKPAILLARIKTHLLLKQARDFLYDKNTYLETEVSRRMQENQIIQNVSIRALAHLAEIRDNETGDHILRTQSYVNVLAKRLQKNPRFSNDITDNFIELLTKSAPLHDIGKVGIPDNILLKKGKLIENEWTIMKTHAKLGSQAIESAETDVDQPVEFLILAKEIAHWHHERWDGSGYPDGLAGDAIPLSARIMALADVFDALISPRVYKPAFPYDIAKDIIVSKRNSHFDPDICDAFLTDFDKFVQIARLYLPD